MLWILEETGRHFQDQVPDGFILETVCRVSETGKTRFNWTEHFSHSYDAEERLERAQAILRQGLIRGVLRLMKERENQE